MKASDFRTLTERRAWLEKQAVNDNTRRAKTAKPRHADIASQCRALLIWRAANAPADWTTVAINDNKKEKPGIDAELETRPRVSEIMRALAGVQVETRSHAQAGGGGEKHVVPVAGDIERSPVLSQQGKPNCIARLGGLRFSNGQQVERGLVLKNGIVQRGEIRIPLGGLVSCDSYKARDRFTRPKGIAAEALAPRRSTNPGAVNFVDPVEEHETAERVREMVEPETAAVLDCALRAANFADVGRLQGFHGKTAERRGKQAVLAACAELEAVLAA